MTDNQQTTWDDWLGAEVVDRDGDKIGKLDAVFADQTSGQPEWLAVKTGLFGAKSTFVPIEGVTAEGSDLKVPFEKAQVKDAPNVDINQGVLDSDEEARLYQHYGLSQQTSSDPGDQGQTGKRKDRGDDGSGHDTSGPSTDDAMTRSEEELAVGTRSQEVGKARLRKYVVTENVTTTVPVRKERVRVEREPITDENVGDATSGPDISEEEHEMVLHEEEVVADKRVVAKERVRLDKDVEVEEQQVSEEVRKEQIEVDEGGKKKPR